MALRFAREGAAALSLIARHADKLDAIRDDVLKIAPTIDIVAIEADVSKSRDIERIVATTVAPIQRPARCAGEQRIDNRPLANAVLARLSSGRFSRSARHKPNRAVLAYQKRAACDDRTPWFHH